MGSKRKPPVGRRFQKGKSGNPAGRPSFKGFKEWLGEVGPGGKTRRENVLEALYLTAINVTHRDRVRAIELVLAYDLGRPVQGIQVSGGDGSPESGGTPVELSVIGRLPKMTTGALRRELEALRQRRDEMTGKKAPPPAPSDATEVQAQATQSDAPPGNSEP